jgi:hypothetical protein
MLHVGDGVQDLAWLQLNSEDEYPEGISKAIEMLLSLPSLKGILFLERKSVNIQPLIEAVVSRAPQRKILDIQVSQEPWNI